MSRKAKKIRNNRKSVEVTVWMIERLLSKAHYLKFDMSDTSNYAKSFIDHDESI